MVSRIFPFGPAPFALGIIAVLAGLAVVSLRPAQPTVKPDLVIAVFAKPHFDAYQAAIPAFEAKHGVKVQLQLSDSRTLTNRMQSALSAGTDVPDLVEFPDNTLGLFTRGPLADVGFVDLTERVKAEGLDTRLVPERLAMWSSRGHIFALPHDIHPLTLLYRRDLVAQLGIDVEALKTWDDLAALAPRIVRDDNGDGVPDRFLLDLQSDGFMAKQLLFQRGGGLMDAQGRVIFDSPEAAEVIRWHVHATHGATPFARGAGWGQSLAKVIDDGLVVFIMCPDWRSKQFQLDMPNQAGNLGLMALPAWQPGGRRTSTWGGTGLAITKACARQDLAWELAKHLYIKADDLAARFTTTNILPPLKEVWNDPAFQAPNAFYGNQRIGQLFADLAVEVPAVHSSPYYDLASIKFSEAFLDAAQHYEHHGDDGLEALITSSLTAKADYVRRYAARNRFLNPVTETP